MVRSLNSLSFSLGHACNVLLSFMIGFYLSYRFAKVSLSLEFLVRCYRYFAVYGRYEFYHLKNELAKCVPKFSHLDQVAQHYSTVGAFYFLSLFSALLLFWIFAKSVLNTMK